MMTKINWFKEVLELEPGSKVFFPLARLYFDDGAYGEALATLRHGLDRNPDHLEARFMLVEILTRLGRDEEAAEEVRTITGMLSRYPSFFRVWSENAAGSSRDSAMALSFLAADFQGSRISWSQVVERGLEAFFSDGGAAKAPKKKKPTAPRKAPETDPNIRTRTMADLLADQGDFQGALTIYEELAKSAADREADELMALIEKMRVKLKKGAPAPEPEQADEAEDQGLAGMVEDVGLAPVPGLDADEGGDFEPSGGAQPMDVPDIEDTEAFDAQALLDDLLSGEEEAEGEPGDDFETELASAPEPEFGGEDADLDAALDGLDALDDLEDVQAAALDEEEAEAELDIEAEPETELEAAPEAAPEAAMDAEGEDAAADSGKDKMLETLEALAERLEARAAT